MRTFGHVGLSGAVREPAVAGRFYEGRADRLAALVDSHVEAARQALAARRWSGPRGVLRAVVVPHAGHIYSGPTAGYAYASLDPDHVRRVVLLGPAHYVPIDGIGSSSSRAWRTPLGEVPIDVEAQLELSRRVEGIVPGDRAHAPEHSLEVQVPFLQRVLREGWTLVPLIVGADLPDEVAEVITLSAAMPGTVVVVSTDLSHYLDHDAAEAADARTIAAVLRRDPSGVGPHDACGRFPLRGLLSAARAQDWAVDLLDARNSGDTAGDRDRVVGYAAFAVHAGADAAESRAEAAEVTGTADGGQLHEGGASTGATDSAEVADAGPLDAGGGSTGATESAEVAAPSGLPSSARVGPAARAELLGLARRTIETGLSAGRRLRADPDDWLGADPVLRAPGAAFVTLRSARGHLLGCIGGLTARQPLVADVCDHAYHAAFRDPRFPPLTLSRAQGMVIDISVLSPSRPFACARYADLLERVPIGAGVVVSAGPRRATFLPAVWEQLPGRAGFLAALWQKARLGPGEWPPGIVVEVYDTEEFAESAH